MKKHYHRPWAQAVSLHCYCGGINFDISSGDEWDDDDSDKTRSMNWEDDEPLHPIPFWDD